jgi:hypothetical protein
MNNHINLDVIEFHQIEITDQQIIIIWSTFPLYKKRKTEYQLTEFYQWVLDDDYDNSKRTLDPFWLIEEMKDVIQFMVQDFHAINCDVFWRKEVTALKGIIHGLKGKIRSMELVISKLQSEKNKLLKRLSQVIKSSF